MKSARLVDPPPRVAGAMPARAHTAAAAVLLAVLYCGYLVLTVRPWNWAYLDYVDGYYLYVAQRMAQGAVLYRGVMGVQPPGVYLVGAALFRLGAGLAALRLYAALLHGATAYLVFRCADRLHGSRPRAVFAAALYLAAPYGLVWSRLFDPNPLVTFLSLWSFYLLLAGSPGAAARSGLVGGLALLTKVWYLPVALGLILALALGRRRDLLWVYLLSCAACIGAACLVGSAVAGAAFWHGLVVQDASATSAAWLEASVWHVIGDEWPLLILALLGARRLLAERRAMDGVALWYLAASCGVLAATIKAGTAWPVFQFAEPALALIAAAIPVPTLRSFSRGRSSARVRVVADVTPPAPEPGRAATVTLMAAFVFGLVALVSLSALRGYAPRGDASERAVVTLIRQHSAPGQALLGPPYYLFLAGRREIGEYADVNLWALQARRGDTASVALAAQTVAALRHGAIPLVIADSRVRNLPGVPAALAARYRRLPFQDPLPSDRAVEIWTPVR